ncbi:helix-turn-helix transcriptional regulator [Chryseobacterium sp. SN22]|uniref:helix-turn-helix domain-containing protein n=1 Tax=Chryseobacterium sp. SN22 TaxID=2606431 RepID=UPI0011EF0FC2|nr:helix-turn-helix transcriptional regulator [Chryseobacterium sp. SN22]KAA0127415.1 helix-turn-helix transcriptional regulator [Chryseobacterium sp. SN22]
MQDKKIHQGRNIKRFREMLGIKQETLAYELGEWSQQKMSILEQKETIEKDILEKIAQLLKIPVEAIENMDDEQAVNIISNTFDNGSILNGINYNPSFHPIDKVLQLHEEKIALYERMLKEKDEMMAKLEQYLQKP